MRPGHARLEPVPPAAGEPVAPALAPGVTAARVAQVLKALARRVKKGAAEARAGEPEGVHDVRVALRRLEAALGVWRDALEPHAFRAARRRARKLRRRLREVRDTEVLLETLARMPAGADTDSLAELRLHWEHELADGHRIVARTLRPARIMRLRRALRRAVAAAPQAPESDVLLGALERYVRREHAAHAALATTRDSDDDEVLHRARIAVKRRRYAEEAFAAGAGTKISAGADSARERQRALGAVHDRAVLRERLLARARKAERRHDPERSAALTAAASRCERWRLEALRAFRSLPGGAPAPRPGG